MILLFCAVGLPAQDRGLYWKYKDYDGAIALSVPRWVIHAGSWFINEKADRKMLRKVRKVRVLVFEDQHAPVTERDLKRFTKKAKKRRLEYLLSVREKQTRVEVWAKERRNVLRKLVVLVREPETFALVSVRGKLKMEEIGELLQELPKNRDGDGEKPLLPSNVRSVIRI